MFLSSFINSLDAKGRVSVPARFRANVDASGFNGVILWPSGTKPCLEGAGLDMMASFQAQLDQLPVFDEGRGALEELLFAASRELGFDSGGRITLPEDLQAMAGLDGQVKFVGLGRRFEIWNPDQHAAQYDASRAKAAANLHRLTSNGGEA